MSEIIGVRHSGLDAALPAGSCDCHTHVFGPPEQFPFDGGRVYTPPVADWDDLLAHQRLFGLDRVVIVQPSPYGTDNSCTLDAVRRLGGERARAVAVIDAGFTRDRLRAMAAEGVRGVRLNLHTAGVEDPARARDMMAQTAEQVVPLGWHVQTFTSLPVIEALHPLLATLPVPLVVDHFGGANAAAGLSQPGMDALLDLVRSGRAFVKLSGPHRVAPDMEGARPIAEALIAANPARMLWGSDWPHPGGGASGRAKERIEPYDRIDDGAALNRLRRWVGDEATLRAILVDNPAGLYGF